MVCGDFFRTMPQDTRTIEDSRRVELRTSQDEEIEHEEIELDEVN